jgi:hypothetical protein
MAEALIIKVICGKRYRTPLIHPPVADKPPVNQVR